MCNHFHIRNLGNTCVIGLFWGDEGKGKIVDLLTEHADVVVRYNGGANAGHTVVVQGQKFALHLIPSGALHPSKNGVIGPGVTLDPQTLLDEIDALAARGIRMEQRLKISKRCHVVLPYHKLEDQLSEASLSCDQKIGTTARGIGPCYADKMLRTTAIRFSDLFRPDDFRIRLRTIIERKQKIFSALYDYTKRIDAEAMADQYLNLAERLSPFLTNTTAYLHQCLARNQRLIFEGAHGTLLDIDHGTYPYVTSSSSSALGVSSGSGVPPRAIQTCVGVVKAYTTRVGQGPFPTELHDPIGQRIRERGHEYGTTTGRPRRCGWFDAVAGRYGVQLGGIDHVALMHLDTLSGFEEVNICTGYEVEGKRLVDFPPEVDLLQRAKPIYETFGGWHEDLSGATSFEQLPRSAQNYVLRIEQLINARISIISVGPERNQTIIRN